MDTASTAFVFVGPALAILAWYLFIPSVRTLVLSFQNDISTQWVGFANYIFAFTDRVMLEAFRNNLLWMIFGTFFSVAFGSVNRGAGGPQPLRE